MQRESEPVASTFEPRPSPGDYLANSCGEECDHRGDGTPGRIYC